jgi:hypothetical protein
VFIFAFLKHFCRQRTFITLLFVFVRAKTYCFKLLLQHKMHQAFDQDREGTMLSLSNKKQGSYRLLARETWQGMMNDIRQKLSPTAIVIFTAALYKVRLVKKMLNLN